MVAVNTGREEENQSTIRLWQQLTQEEKKKIKVLGYGSS